MNQVPIYVSVRGNFLLVYQARGREFYYASQSKTWYDNTAHNTWAELVGNTEETALLLAGGHLQSGRVLRSSFPNKS